MVFLYRTTGTTFPVSREVCGVKLKVIVGYSEVIQHVFRLCINQQAIFWPLVAYGEHVSKQLPIYNSHLAFI